MKLSARSLLVLSIATGIAACDSTSSQVVTPITLQITEPDRRIFALEDSTLRLDIFVNGARVSTNTIPPGATTTTISISGVIPNATNTIELIWYETLNGFDVELSRQTQVFLADGDNINIDSPHITDIFDYDNDGESNIAERANGSCVWSANEICLASATSDIPTPDSSITPITRPQTAGTSTPQISSVVQPNTVLFSDFSNGKQSWYTIDETPSTTETGEFCATLRAGPVGLSVFLISHTDFQTIETAQHSIEFDARATSPATISIGLFEPSTGRGFLDEYIDISTTTEKYIVNYNHIEPTNNGIHIGFNAMFLDVPATFCFDNIRLANSAQ